MDLSSRFRELAHGWRRICGERGAGLRNRAQGTATAVPSGRGCAVHAATGQHSAANRLAAVIFSLLCSGCAQTPSQCRDEVAAAFERLRTSARPYRKETVYIVSERQTFRETAEFVPPDRMRKITNNGAPGYGTVETIRIGERVWSNEYGRWRKWEPGLAEEIYGEGMDFSPWPDRAVSPNAKLECLGWVIFHGTVYTGYRALLPKSAVLVTKSGVSLSKEEKQELSSKLRQMPQEWRTVFVNWRGLPAYDLVAQEHQLDSPSYKIQYTYSGDIKIEPPAR